MIAVGYEDGNDANRLHTVAMFKLAMERLEDETAPCSQPTISRLENLPDTRAVLRMGQAMVDLGVVQKRVTAGAELTLPGWMTAPCQWRLHSDSPANMVLIGAVTRHEGHERAGGRTRRGHTWCA